MIINLIHKCQTFPNWTFQLTAKFNTQFSWLTCWRGVCNGLAVSVCKRERQEVETHSEVQRKEVQAFTDFSSDI